jgi:hypothetical protein
MKQLKSKLQNLRDLFDRNLTAKWLAEAFKSFDCASDAPMIKAFMEEYDYDVVGVRKNGSVIGYVKRADLKDGVCEKYLVKFNSCEKISETTPLAIILKMFLEHPRLYMVYLNEIVGIVTKGDLQKSPVRMWLFSLISLLEMQLLRVIREFHPRDSWRQCLKECRLKKAQEIFEDRKRKNQNIDLADCLQFCDKRDIILKNENILKLIGDDKKSIEKLLIQLEKVRDNLAHAQDIITGFWPDIADIVEKTETLIDRLEQVTASDAGKKHTP